MIIRYHRSLLLITLLAVITACSFKTLYNNLDSLIPRYVEDMVSLDDVLEEKFESRTQALLIWHRNTQLLQYANWLRAVQQDVGPQLTEQKVQQRIGEVEQFWRVLTVKINAEMAQLLPLLNQEQLQQLFASLKESNDAFQEKFIAIDEQERREKYFDNLYEVYENWLGDLSDEQEAAIRKASLALVGTAEMRMQRRLDWQKGIRDILSGDASQQQKSAALQQFFSEFEDYVTPAMKANADINRGIIARLTVYLSHGLSQQQHAFFISRTDETIRMLTELAENR
jgi:hypothetical protein